MRKKRFLLGAVALTAALAATGCSSTPNGSQAADSAKNQADTGKDSGSADSGSRDSGSEDTSKAAGADRNISCTLTLATWDVAAAKTFEELDMEGRFQELYPNVEIDIEEFNAEPEYFNSMKIRSSASELPDLMFHKSDSMNQYSEYLADLTDTEANKNNQIASEYAVDGKVLGIPDRKASDYVYYWTDMFDEAGVAYPEEGWTYDDMLEIAKKLTIPGEQYGVGIAASNADPSNVFMTLSPIVWSYGADFLNEDQTECTLNTPEAMEAVRFFTGLYTTEKVTPEGVINYTMTKDIMPLFIENKVGMMMGGDQNAVEFDTNYPDLKYGFCVPPKSPASSGGWMFTVPVTAKNPDAAFDFAKWFLQPEVLGELTIRIPARKGATEYGIWNSPLYQTVLESAMVGRLNPTTPAWTDMQKIIIVELQNIMQGAKTVEQGCEDMTRQCNALLK